MTWAHLCGRPGVLGDLGAPVVLHLCQPARVASNSMVSMVLLSRFRLSDSGLG